MKLAEAIKVLQDAVTDTNIDVNFSSDRGIEIHWFSVSSISCGAGTAAKVIPALKQLEIFGMKDC